MKNQALFSSNDKNKKLNSRLLQFLFGALRVNKNLGKNLERYTQRRTQSHATDRMKQHISHKKQTTKFYSSKFQKLFHPSCIILSIDRNGGKTEYNWLRWLVITP